MSVLEKFDVGVIVRDQFRTLRRFDTDSYSKWDIVFFVGFPLAPMTSLPMADVYLPRDSIGALMTALAVFGALLFNMLLLIYDIADRKTNYAEHLQHLRARLLSEIHANVAFAVLVAIVSLVVLTPEAILDKAYIAKPVSIIFYYLGTLFFLSLLMVLRRTHVLMKRDIGAVNGPQPPGI